MLKKKIFFFNDEEIDNQSLLGFKGANLSEMWKSGIPVPFGFIISTEYCKEIITSGGINSVDLLNKIHDSVRIIESQTKKRFGHKEDPLLLAARISTPFPIPKLTSTILNIGINEKIAFPTKEQNIRSQFLKDTYLRFIRQFSISIMDIPIDTFNQLTEDFLKNDLNNYYFSKNSYELWIQNLLSFIQNQTNKVFPQDPYEQLEMTLNHIILTWNNNFIKNYYKMKNIDIEWPLAIIVQEMVFGNMGGNSGCGVAFTQNPVSGDSGLCGYYMPNAQGTDIFLGLQIPKDISYLQKSFSKIYEELKNYCHLLEKHFRNPQEVYFVIEQNILYILKTQKLRSTGIATLKGAVRMVGEGTIQESEGILMIDTKVFSELSQTGIDPNMGKCIASGIPVNPGTAIGRIAFDLKEIKQSIKKDPIILIREHITFEEIINLKRVMGILIYKGGITSHAAIIAKGMDNCCILSIQNASFNKKFQHLNIGQFKLKKGDWITIDGYTGRIFLGKIRIPISKLNPYFNTLISWIKKEKKIEVRANCDNSQSCRLARNNGAEGIGLCRTEYMFATNDRIDLARMMLLTEILEERKEILKKMEVILEVDFIKMFKEMDGMPVVIRSFDFPLHEFLPSTKNDIMLLSKKIGLKKTALQKRIDDLYERNPMLGVRGCRLGILYPDITKTQARAFFHAVVRAKQEGIDVKPSIMIPFVMDIEEIRNQSIIFHSVAQKIMADNDISFNYEIGAMIEQPRAALLAGQIAEEVDFLSFGTNDLTQLTFGLSRDDTINLLKFYFKNDLLLENPFKVLDKEGVGKLLQIAISLARSANSKITIGICGEHAGDPKSIEFLLKEGLDYISCSISDISIASLSAAQATINNSRGEIQIDNKEVEFDENRIWTNWCMQHINNEIKKENYEKAQKVAFLWASQIGEKYNLTVPNNWKFFKRNLVSKWFGKREYKRFSSGWLVKDVLEYTLLFPDQSLRLSLFPKNIACHAVSYCLPKEDRYTWPSIISSIDNSYSMEIFPIFPSDSMCFRAFYSLGEFFIEASKGQAMYVFEQEKGEHPIIFAQQEVNKFSFSYMNTHIVHTNEIDDIKKKLQLFINKHSNKIKIQCECLRIALGIDYISIEGYFDIRKPQYVLVCDLDLPQDVAFAVTNLKDSTEVI